MRNMLSLLMKKDDGSTAIEFALIAVLVSIILVVSARNLGDETIKVYTYITESITGVK